MGNELSQHIDQAQKSGILQLRNFKLTKIPNEIIGITQNLRNLDLSNNKINLLPSNLFLNMKILKNLNLSSNRLESLPSEIGLLVKLETLNVSENNLTQLPSSVSQLKNLKQINLSKNSLKTISRELCGLKQLDHLDLSSNKIERIDDYISELNAIELNLNENHIRVISVHIAKCPRLKVIRLEQNVLELAAIPVDLLANSNVSLISYEGNLFTNKQFEQIEGYDKYLERYTATRRKFD